MIKNISVFTPILIFLAISFLSACGGGGDSSSSSSTSSSGGPTTSYANPVALYTYTLGSQSSAGLWIDNESMSFSKVADFNGDGFDDLLITHMGNDVGSGASTTSNARSIKIFLQDGSGGIYDGTSSMFVGTPPSTALTREVVVADFNADGQVDIFLANHGLEIGGLDYSATDPRIWKEPDVLLLSNGSGKYVTGTIPTKTISNSNPDVNGGADIDYGNNYYTHGAVAGDIDGDGDNDIVINTTQTPQGLGIIVYINNGSGLFTFGTGNLPTLNNYGYHQNISADLWIDFIDADGDGDLDLFRGSKVAIDHAILLNDGTGNFGNAGSDFDITHANNIQLPPTLLANSSIETSAVMDIDGDGDNDMVIGNSIPVYPYTNRVLQVLINNRGIFVDETSSRLPTSAGGSTRPNIQKVDMDGDGDEDIINIIGTSDNPVSDFYKNNNGIFERVNIVPDYLPMNSIGIDLGNDGDLDFIGSDWFNTLGTQAGAIIEAL